jgi:hypothetical protein
MSIYVMTVGELAKKRGEPVGDFVKKVQAVGFDAGSHAKKLTQSDLDVIIGLLDAGTQPSPVKKEESKERAKLENPNVLMVKLPDGKTIVALVEASVNSSGVIDFTMIENSIEDSIGEALLEFRRKMGMHMGVN